MKKIKKQHEVALQRYPCTCPHCKKKIIIRHLWFERIGQKIILECNYCGGSIKVKVVGPLLSNFVIEGFDPRENVRIEK